MGFELEEEIRTNFSGEAGADISDDKASGAVKRAQGEEVIVIEEPEVDDLSMK